MTSGPPPVVVWGNCQGRPLAALLRAPLAAHGRQILDVPTVFEATAAEVAGVRAQLAAPGAVLVTQPIRDEYRHAGCGSEQLAALVPASGRVVRLPSAIHTGWFPYQSNAHDETGVRVPAPLVTYHDLRLLAASAAGRSADDVLRDGLGRASDDAVRKAAAASVAELRRREAGVDVVASDLVDAPDAMFAMNHPSNRTLGAIAARVLRYLGLAGEISLPDREFLGEYRTPVEAHVVAARGAGREQPEWVVRREVVPWADVVRAHLALYAARPAIVRDARERWAERFVALGL